jgi:putative endonuclease
MIKHIYYVYIITNPSRKTLYVGITNNLHKRILEHYSCRGTDHSFTGFNYCYLLLYYETFSYVNNAIAREKEIKGWRRSKKEILIDSMNKERKMLNAELFGKWPPGKEWDGYVLG